MPKVSREPLKEEELGQLMHAFWRALAALRSPRDVESMLAGFLTHTEIKMFAKRLRAAAMLLRGDSYAEIRRALKMTDTPITRLNNLLHENKRFRDMLGKIGNA